jgi:hypothetical protein
MMSQGAVRAVIRRSMAFWRPITGLDRWTIDVRWGVPPDGNDDAPAAFCATPEYLTGTLYINMPALMRSEYVKSDRHVSFLVLHELCHGLNWEVVDHAEPYARTEPFRQSMERCTCMTARAVWVARFRREPPE